MRLEGFLRHSHFALMEEHVGAVEDVVLRGVERNLMHLTTDVDDFPRRMQRHVTGLPWTWVWPLKRVVAVVFCYKYVHEDSPVDD